MPDAYLDADTIRASTFIRHVEIHDTLGSTNDRAAELARDPHIELPALIAAHHQTAGRGRGTNTWRSAEGALTFSVLLDPTVHGISTAKWPQLSLATAVTICDALADELNPKSEIRNPKSSSRLAIKWPNDIMLDGKKVAGILIESPAIPAKSRLIIGIGINVNNSWHDQSADRGLAHDDEKPPTAIALRDATHRAHNIQHLLESVLQALETRSSQLSSHDPQLPATWQQLSWLTDQRVEVQSNGQQIDGVCRGIDGEGTLVVENVSGTHQVRSGSVAVL